MLTPRLAAVLEALPLRPGMRVLEIGGAPGALAREVARRVGEGHVLVVDRSPRGVALTERACAAQIAAGRITVRCCEADHLALAPGEAAYDLVVANRVGVLDGRHPGEVARARIRDVLAPGGRLFVDGVEVQTQ